MTRRARALFGLIAVAALGAGLPGVAAGHHVGTYTPRDNPVSANFKQIKFSIQARKFDVALRLFETGALRREMRAQASRLPAGLEASTRAALTAGDARAAEGSLLVFFAALVRDLALEGERQVSDATAPLEVRAAAGRKFLEAIWRYYNLVDFALTQLDTRAAAAVRLAFDEAEGYVQPTAAPPAPPDRMREPLRRIAQILTRVIDTSSTAARRDS
jgi:hypothetical protein